MVPLEKMTWRGEERVNRTGGYSSRARFPPSGQVPYPSTGAELKVFWFFSSEKNILTLSKQTFRAAKMGTITTVLDQTVTAGQGAYTGPLVIAPAGGIEPAGYGLLALMVDVAGFSVSNQGTLIGGAHGGNGVYFESTGTLVNDGTIGGGAGGGFGLLMSGGASATSTGLIFGGAAASGFAGGIGVSLSGNSSLANAGEIYGGAGGYYGGSRPQTGGAGVYMVGGALTNTGTIAGGANAGVGVRLGFATMLNSGTVEGGSAGGTAVYAESASLTNQGTIAGGAGVQITGDLGAGGMGCVLDGGTLINQGTIAGGDGADHSAGSGYAGAGGTGVLLEAGTLVTSGLIAGGAGGYDSLSGTFAAQGDAVLVDGPAATLELLPGAQFEGAVVATPSMNDTLALGGTVAATLSLSGTQFSGFADIVFETGAIWTLDGSLALAAATQFAGVTAADTLKLSGGGRLGHVGSGFGTLELSGADAFSMGFGAPVSANQVRVDQGALLAGGGRLDAALAVDGTVLAAAGTALVLAHDVTGTGELAAAAGGTLMLEGGFDWDGRLAGHGTIDILARGSFGAGANLAGASVVQEADIVLAPGLHLADGAGTFDIVAKQAGKDVTLSGGPGSLFANGGVMTKSGPGDARILTRFVNSGEVSITAGVCVLAGPVINTGVMQALGGILSCAQAVSGTGSLAIGARGVLVLQDGATAGQSVTFSAGGGLLDLLHPSAFLGGISGFTATDAIELVQTYATRLDFVRGFLTVLDDGIRVAQLHVLGSYTASNFVLVHDHQNTLIEFHGQ
jgi:hypothetical protein